MNNQPVSSQPNEHLKRERLLQGWSQQDVGTRIGTDGYTVSRWERGKAVPSPYFRQKLCTLFGKNIEELGLHWKEKKLSLVSLDIAATEPLSQSTKMDQAVKADDLPLPEYWYFPYQRNPFFIGREQLLQFLYQVLSPGQPFSRTYALSGLSGIGKTQIAMEYVYRYFRQYSAIFWLGAETDEQLISCFVSIATLLHLPEQLRQEQNAVIASVIHWLNMHSGWLLIIDNLEHLDVLRDRLPTGGQGSLLFTTRLRTLGTLAPVAEVMPLLPEESLKLLQRRTESLNVPASRTSYLAEECAAAREIVSATGGLPLALDQVGAYVEAYKCTMLDIVQLLHRNPLRLWYERGMHTDSSLSVARTYTLSLEQLRQKNVVAADLFIAYCFLAPDEIPEKLMLEGRAYLGSHLQEALVDAYHLHDVTRELLACTLIHRNAERQAVTVHPLIQTVLRESLPEALQQQWSRRMIFLINQLFFLDSEAMNAEYLAWCEMLLPHACLVVSHGERWKFVFPEFNALLIKVALYLHRQSRYTEAYSFYQRARAVQEYHPEGVQSEQLSLLLDQAPLPGQP